MSKVGVTEYMTLDGVIEEPSWSVPFRSDDARTFKRAELFASDALLLGRVTYEGFAQAWPGSKDDDGFADRMNSMPKYVASITLIEMEWNATRIEGDVVAAVTALKQQPGQDLLVYGSGGFAQTLMAHDLVDEYRLMVLPVVLGRGKRLFQEGSDTKTLRLVDSKTFALGVVVLTYSPVREG